MFSSSSGSFVALVAYACSLFAAACSSAPPSEAEGTSGQAATAVNPAFTLCAFDSDCVAVAQAGCCSNGWLAAVNADLVCAYDDANKCTQQVACPQYVVDDTRVAICSNASLACEMIAPASIRCGGDGVNPHTCPAGYDCVLGADDTSVGTCTQSVATANEDAGNGGN